MFSDGVLCRLHFQIYVDKVPLRDVPKGLAQERTEKHTSCDIISYAYDVIEVDYGAQTPINTL